MSFYWFTDDGISGNPFCTEQSDDTDAVILFGVKPGEPETGFQSHVHEFLGSTKLSGDDDEAHNHRFAGITGEAVYVPGSHVHRIEVSTDYCGHYHAFQAISGPAVYLCRHGKAEAGQDDTKHVHYAEGWTTRVGTHRHAVEAATLMEAPLPE